MEPPKSSFEQKFADLATEAAAVSKAIDDYETALNRVEAIAVTNTVGMNSFASSANTSSNFYQPYQPPNTTHLVGGMYPGFDVPTLPPLCLGGHVASEETIEYVDGVIVGKCQSCGERMQVNRVSGGVSLLRIKHMLGVIMAIDEETVRLDDFSMPETVGELATVRSLLEAEEFAVRQARKLFDLAERLLQKKVME